MQVHSCKEKDTPNVNTKRKPRKRLPQPHKREFIDCQCSVIVDESLPSDFEWSVNVSWVTRDVHIGGLMLLHLPNVLPFPLHSPLSLYPAQSGQIPCPFRPVQPASFWVPFPAFPSPPSNSWDSLWSRNPDILYCYEEQLAYCQMQAV